MCRCECRIIDRSLLSVRVIPGAVVNVVVLNDVEEVPVPAWVLDPPIGVVELTLSPSKTATTKLFEFVQMPAVWLFAVALAQAIRSLAQTK